MQTQDNSMLGGIKAMRDSFMLDHLQHYLTETHIWGAAAQVFRLLFLQQKMWKTSEPQDGPGKYSSNQIFDRAMFVKFGESVQVQQADIFLQYCVLLGTLFMH